MARSLDSDPPQIAGGRTSIAVFALIAVLMATDLTIEYRRGVSVALQTFELLIFVSALAGIALHWWQLAAARQVSARLDRELSETRAEARRWSQGAQDVLAGLGVAMDRQFDKWGLTPAEREVALLQLKGLRHKAIAELRQTSERTVRQQALTIYRKSGLNGRTDLAAFFLEDLFLPGRTSSAGRQGRARSTTVAAVMSVLPRFALISLTIFTSLAMPGTRLHAQGASADLTRPLTLENALDMATSRNLGLAAARRQRAIRDAAVRTAGQRLNPDVGVDFTQDVPHYGVMFNFPVEIAGRRGRRIDLAKEELTLADVDVQTEMRSVRREVRAAFYSVVAAGEQVQLADTARTIAGSLRDAAQLRFDAGAAPRLEVLQADLGVTRAETDLDLARSARAVAQAMLDGVLNLPPQQTLTLTGTLADRLASPTYDSAIALAIASNVDLVRLDKEIAIEQRRLDLVRAERTPVPVFSIGGVFSSPELSKGIAGSVGIGLPIFSRNQGEIAASIAAASQLRARRDALRRAIETNIFVTLAKIDTQRRQVDAYQQRLVPTAANLETLAQESYRAGRTSVLDVLIVQRSLRDFRREALQAALDLQLLLADLEELLGSALP